MGNRLRAILLAALFSAIFSQDVDSDDTGFIATSATSPGCSHGDHFQWVNEIKRSAISFYEGNILPWDGEADLFDPTEVPYVTGDAALEICAEIPLLHLIGIRSPSLNMPWFWEKLRKFVDLFQKESGSADPRFNMYDNLLQRAGDFLANARGFSEYTEDMVLGEDWPFENAFRQVRDVRQLIDEFILSAYRFRAFDSLLRLAIGDRQRTEDELKPERDVVVDLALFKKSVFSSEGMDGILEKVFDLLTMPHQPYYVEIGTHWGHVCNTRYLRLEKGWNGVMYDSQYRNPYVNLQQAMIYKENIATLLKRERVPLEFDLFSIDIMGMDYHILESMLDAGYRPRVIVSAFMWKAPVGFDYVPEYDPNYVWPGMWSVSPPPYASLSANARLCLRYGYHMVGLSRDNIVFINAVDLGLLQQRNVSFFGQDELDWWLERNLESEKDLAWGGQQGSDHSVMSDDILSRLPPNVAESQAIFA